MTELADGSIFVPAPNGGTQAGITVVLKRLAASRSFRLTVKDGARAVLTMPKYASKKEALAFLEKNADWLLEKTATAKKAKTFAQYLLEGGAVYALGREISVQTIPSRTSPFFVDDFENGKLVFALARENQDAQIQKLFLEYAAEKLQILCAQLSEQTGLKFSRISVRDQSSRWASRSTSGTLSLNWRIMLLKPEHQKYVVLHELAHTKFMDHSVSFWIFLNRICPNAQKLDREISRLGGEIFAVKLV